MNEIVRNLSIFLQKELPVKYIALDGPTLGGEWFIDLNLNDKIFCVQYNEQDKRLGWSPITGETTPFDYHPDFLAKDSAELVQQIKDHCVFYLTDILSSRRLNMNVQPLRDFVVVSKDESVKTTPGGLFVPSTNEEKIVTGTVMAVGSGRVVADGTVVPLEVKVGDKVAFNKNLATELKVGGETYLLLREDQALCVLR